MAVLAAGSALVAVDRDRNKVQVAHKALAGMVMERRTGLEAAGNHNSLGREDQPNCVGYS